MARSRSQALFLILLLLSLGLCLLYYSSPTLRAMSTMSHTNFACDYQQLQQQGRCEEGQDDGTDICKGQANLTSSDQETITKALSPSNETRWKPKVVITQSATCLKIFSSTANDSSPATLDEQSMVERLLQIRDCPWIENRATADNFRRRHGNASGGAARIVVTRTNSPINSSIVFDQSKKTLVVDQKLTELLLQDFPERKKRYPRCAVVGNGGILSNSSCGAQIDQMDFVIRCNLPPVGGSFLKDVGGKTNFVTANPTILIKRFESLIERRKEFTKTLSSYGSSIVLIPGFSISAYTSLAYRAVYALDDLGSEQRVGFFNPAYMRAITDFWKKWGVREQHLTSGLMMTSVAMDLCDEVHVYGFWPFGHDLPTRQQVRANKKRLKRTKRSAKSNKKTAAAATLVAAAPIRTLGRALLHHYYDNQLPKKVHSMPSEFSELLRLHCRGVLNLHVNACGD